MRQRLASMALFVFCDGFHEDFANHFFFTKSLTYIYTIKRNSVCLF